MLDDVTHVDRERCVALARVVPTHVDESRPIDELAIIRYDCQYKVDLNN
jgi:hypothetical protein